MILVGLVIGFTLGIIAMGYYHKLLMEELLDTDHWVDAEDVFKRLGHGDSTTKSG